MPQEFGFLGRLLLKGVKPVDADPDRQLLEAAVRDHTTNGDAYSLARIVTYRDEPHPEQGLSVDDMTVHRFQEKTARSNTGTFGWASWLDAGTADAVLRRFLTFDNAQRAVIGAWEHGGRFHASPYQRPDAPVNPSLRAQWGEMLRFFDAHLKDSDNGVRDEKVLFYYTLGEETWKKSHVWPPEGTTMQRWYLGENGTLSPDAPRPSPA